jgi:hypothetical protein
MLVEYGRVFWDIFKWRQKKRLCDFVELEGPSYGGDESLQGGL